FFFVVIEPVKLQTNGVGNISGLTNRQPLEIGRGYVVTASVRAGSGYAFVNWTGGTNQGQLSVLSTNLTLSFIMQSNLCLVANFKDVTRPNVSITIPAANSRVSNDVITVRGTASDNAGVSNLWMSINGGAWQPGQTTNQWTNWWVADVPLVAGTNVARAFGADPTGNLSLTNGASFFFVVIEPVKLQTNGVGNISGLTNRQPLEIGRGYVVTASVRAGSGYAFVNWTGGTNQGQLSVLSTNLTLSFIMQSNLCLVANFKD